MSSHLVPRVSVVAVIAAAVVSCAVSEARAAGDCQAQPFRQASAGGHWYYYVDRAARRKCWYMAASSARALAAEAAVPPSPDAAPTLASVLASLKAGLFGGSPAQPQSAPANASAASLPSGEPRVRRHIQHAPRRTHLEDTAEGSAAPLTEAQRDLFQQFLEWRAMRQMLE